MRDKPITPENLEQAGFECIHSGEFGKGYQFGDISVSIIFATNEIQVWSDDIHTYATTMAHIEQLKELLLGIKPEPKPITQQALLDNGFVRRELGDYCFGSDTFFLLVYFHDVQDIPVEVIIFQRGGGISFEGCELEKMTLGDLLVLKQIVEY